MCNMDSVLIPRPPAPPIGLFNFTHSSRTISPNMAGLHPPALPPPMLLRQLNQAQRQLGLASGSGLNSGCGGGTSGAGAAPIPPPKPESVRSKKSAGSGGFRLMENQDDTGSVYSIYKQKIDAMFESDASSSTKNSVQARIEKMFTDIAIDNGIPVTNDIGCHTFSVDYLGSVPLQEKVTSLTGLQKPLKDLYFAYKRTTRVGKGLSGKLEISGAGLKVQYQGEKGDLEQLNSFPTIAVWSAVKFVIHNDPQRTYAFLPLITDPDNIDKQQLFKTLDVHETKYINGDSHSPLFAVVMRKIGVHKQLECHGFVCQTSEDAIVIAATLYKSLMAHMKAKEKRPKNRNGVTCMSITSSNINESSVPVRPPRKRRSTTSSTISDGEILDADTTPLIADHATSSSNKPKKSSKTKRAPKAPEFDLDAILPYEDPIQPETNTLKSTSPIPEIKPAKLSDKWNIYMSQNQKQIAAEIMQISESSNMGLKRVKSLRKRNTDEIKSSAENSGDILTKVTIPRSGSFLNAGGLTRYKSKVHRSNGQATGGSPLGFNELFNEFRLQEGLHSVDEILGVIIDSEGMSFNDLKPIYKEFLLKLAVTLTKDELYQRSKSIMRRQKKKLLRRTSSVTTKRKHVVVCSKFNKRLKHVFQKLNIVKHIPEEANCLPVNEEVTDKIPESSISSSSYDTRQFRPKEVQITRKQSYRKRASDLKAVNNRTRRDRTSTSEESDFFSLRRSKSKTHSLLQANQNRNSSSGYVSYSECSYDSDTCTCITADKCYCSLGTNKLHKAAHNCKKLCRTDEKCYCTLKSEHLTFCGCDTDSCTDSNKCYCNPPKGTQLGTTSGHQGSIFEQLKQRGFIRSSGSATTPPNCRKRSKKNSNTKSTRSLEYMSNPMEKYYDNLKPPIDKSSSRRTSGSVDNLALDYDMFMQHRASYGRSISESGGLDDGRFYNQRLMPHHHASSANPHNHTHEALSVKKSAEIAALFTDIKLTQTTDIGHLPNHQQHLSIHNQQRYPHHQHQRGASVGGHPVDVQLQNRMILNSLYTIRQKNGRIIDGMYSTKNGLYTIQSQSDDSRGSSVHKEQTNNGGMYGACKVSGGVAVGGGSSSLENSLGYLP